MKTIPPELELISLDVDDHVPVSNRWDQVISAIRVCSNRVAELTHSNQKIIQVLEEATQRLQQVEIKIDGLEKRIVSGSVASCNGTYQSCSGAVKAV